MKTKPNLNELAKVVFEANKTKGFHDTDISNDTLLMLVITELSEAVEADRKGKRFSLKEYEYETMTECQGWLTPDEKYKNVFESQVKDTLEDELADVVIRLLDLTGLRSYKLSTEEGDIVKYAHCHPIDEKFESFAEHIFAVVKLVSGNYDMDFTTAEIIELTILSIEHICNILSIDLWLHVELKLKYNTIRPHKHNKSY